MGKKSEDRGSWWWCNTNSFSTLLCNLSLRSHLHVCGVCCIFRDRDEVQWGKWLPSSSYRQFYELRFIYCRQDTQKYFDPQNFIEIGVGSWSCVFLGMTSERGGLVAVCWDSLHCPNLDFSMKHLVFCKQQPNHKVTFVSNDNSNRTLQKR